MLILPQFFKKWGVEATNMQRTLDLESENLKLYPA